MPSFKRWAVTLWKKDNGKSWMYVQEAQDGATAIIQARLCHAGKGLPEIDPTRSTAKEV